MDIYRAKVTFFNSNSNLIPFFYFSIIILCCIIGNGVISVSKGSNKQHFNI